MCLLSGVACARAFDQDRRTGVPPCCCRGRERGRPWRCHAARCCRTPPQLDGKHRQCRPWPRRHRRSSNPRPGNAAMCCQTRGIPHVTCGRAMAHACHASHLSQPWHASRARHAFHSLVPCHASHACHASHLSVPHVAHSCDFAHSCHAAVPNASPWRR